MHYERLLNEEFPWSPEDLPVAEPVAGLPILVTSAMIAEAITKMKSG